MIYARIGNEIDARHVETLSSQNAAPETWDVITQEEEQDLTNLMSEYDFAIKDAERFVDMLQQRLTDLDVVRKFFRLFFIGMLFFPPSIRRMSKQSWHRKRAPYN